MNDTRLNPTATSYAPGLPSDSNMLGQVSAPPSPYLEARVVSLEQGHLDLWSDMDSLTEMYHNLCSSVDKLKRGGWPVTVGPFQEQDLNESHQHAMNFKQELEQLSREVRESVDGDADPSDGQHYSTTTPNNPLVTDGPVDTLAPSQIPAPEPSPPSSPVTIVPQDLPVDQLSLTAWNPHYLTTLEPLSATSKIPTAEKMVTFHPAFLEQHLGGIDWSPGLRYVVNDPACFLKNRTYYLLDTDTDPYLPEKPGEHGAKLTAFFNESPEDKFGELPGGLTSYEDVPMFVAQKDSQGRTRYAYFGNYTQSRWSDKLDYDTMMARVPQHVKEYWATELTSSVRQDWVTKELKNHFFKKPEYEGRIFAAPEADTTTVTSEVEIKLNDKMARDVQKYVDQLRDWEREAKMKTAMIKKQFVLDAFDAADADDPPALRLWWEYLQCVDWRKDFYDLLVTIQSRKPDQFLK
ncbi:hypothetical protein EK21DRAFT_54977 [Setomelanomma holmii]|uniref:DUF6697 domain-containing protein n=1 Tax=Setomelanomma holmii TaxID=210430 RepID=A0A9P4LSZ8_9PLEO|nr:hypothetical protein EK21DRAFT_54977 [Setomelanomma holmii]